jgi:ribosomal protein L7Ae-like RNA K-turn-binding protein
MDNEPSKNEHNPPETTGLSRRAASLLSICQKAGKLASGEVACEKALQNGTAKLVIICTDASDRTKKKFTNKAFYYKVNCIVRYEKDEISRNIGKINRAVIAVTDEGFAKALYINGNMVN